MLAQLKEWKVERPEMKAEILAQMGQLFDIQRTLTHSPLPNPVPLIREHFDQLRTVPYCVSEKTDGQRYALFLGTYRGSQERFSVLVDRENVIYQIEVVAPKEAFQGTLLDGEHVEDREGHNKFLVFEVVQWFGEVCTQKPLPARMAHAEAGFSPAWHPGNNPHELARHLASQGFVVVTEPMMMVVPKLFRDFKDFGSLIKERPNHASDGYVFTPLNEPVRHGTHPRIFKYKFSPTVDLKRVKSMFFCMTGPHFVEVTSVIPGLKFHPSCLTIKDGSVAEFSIAGDLTCTLHRERHDKLTPNQSAVINDIVQELKGRIDVHELVALATGLAGP
jgi:hypothetical protein